jgi:hypothetical protein
MTCMDRHDTSPPLHSMIPNTSTLPHLIFLVTPSLSMHSTPFLFHQPQAIPQSSTPTPGANPSH